MGSLNRLVRCGVSLVVLLGALAACSSPGDLAIYNKGPGEVTVSIGSEEHTVSADGGVVLLRLGCTEGDVTVEFNSGQTVTVPGPVCPDKQISIRDGRAELQPADE